MAYTGKSQTGATYNIGSEKGQAFINSGTGTMVGADDSVWEKQKDGSTKITTKGGQVFTVAAPTQSTATQPAATGGGSKGSGSKSGGGTTQNPTAQQPAPASKPAATTPAASAETRNYMQELLDAMDRGESSSFVKNLYDERQHYIDTDPDNLGQYRGDNAELITNYIYNKQQEELGNQFALDWEAYQKEINDKYDTLLQQAQAANQAGVALSVEQIKANLENGLPGYAASAEEAYLKMLQSQRNQRLQSTYNGDMGGIGIKQYSDAAAQYDAALLQIALEKQAFINSSNQQIAQLQAEGRLQDAQILADWAQSKIDRYDQDFQWYNELLFKQEQADMQQGNLDREFAYNRAIGMLERGMVTADAIEALGISAEEAQDYANYYNQLAALNLREAEAQFAALYSELSGGDTGFTGSMFVTRANGGYEEMIDFKNGEPVGTALHNGDSYVDEDDNVFVFYNGRFITQSQYEYEMSKNPGTAGNTNAAAAAWAQKYRVYAPEGRYSTPDAVYYAIKRLAESLSREISTLRQSVNNRPSGQAGVTSADLKRLQDAEAKLSDYQRAMYDFENIKR